MFNICVFYFSNNAAVLVNLIVHPIKHNLVTYQGPGQCNCIRCGESFRDGGMQSIDRYLERDYFLLLIYVE